MGPGPKALAKALPCGRTQVDDSLQDGQTTRQCQRPQGVPDPTWKDLKSEADFEGRCFWRAKMAHLDKKRNSRLKKSWIVIPLSNVRGSVTSYGT